MSQIDNPADAGGTDTENQGKTFTQEQLDAIIGERLAKEKAKYADYDDIKAKASKYDEMEEASKSELQKAQEQSAAYKTELDELKKAESIRSIRDKVSKDTGVPANLLTSDTEEACKAQADAIKAYVGDNQPKGKKIPDGGEKGGTTGKTTAELFGDWFNESLKK